ncbi:MAG: hypothetical protein PVI06_08500 [Desulfobacterales bacterium]|jgi:hypothetical protein
MKVWINQIREGKKKRGQIFIFDSLKELVKYVFIISVTKNCFALIPFIDDITNGIRKPYPHSKRSRHMPKSSIGSSLSGMNGLLLKRV